MIRRRTFRSPAGIAELFLAGNAVPGPNFRAEAETLLAEYRAALDDAGFAPENALLLRFHLSDPVNQYPQLAPLVAEYDLPIAVIGQPPADGNRVALESWLWSATPRHYEARFFHVKETTAGNSCEQLIKNIIE